MFKNSAILQCPECDHGLVNMGSSIQRIHPIPKYIQRNYDRILVVWYILTPFLVYLMALSLRGGGDMRSLAIALLVMIFTPPLVMTCIRRAFPIYRITDCPFCGYHGEVKLGYHFYA